MITETPGMSTPPSWPSIPTSRNSLHFGGTEYQMYLVPRPRRHGIAGSRRRLLPPADRPLAVAQSLPPKPYEVAQAIPNACPSRPWVRHLPPITRATSISVNSPANPNLEFSITNFSQLYLVETGHALTPSSVIGIGALRRLGDDGNIGDAFFPENTFTLAQATVRSLRRSTPSRRLPS